MIKKSKLLIISSIILFVLCIIGTVTYAFFKYGKSENVTVNPGTINDSYIVYKTYRDGQLETVTNNDNSEVLSVSLYASKKTGTDMYDYDELCDLHIDVRVDSDVDCRVRVKLEDVWQSLKIYISGKMKTTTITSDYNEENEVFPYTFDDDWVYDHENGYVYYKNVVSSGVTTLPLIVNDESNDKYYHEFSSTTTGYKEAIIVSISVKVDVVQANRALAIWGTIGE